MKIILAILVLALIVVFLPIQVSTPKECIVAPCPQTTTVTPFKFVMHKLQPTNWRWSY